MKKEYRAFNFDLDTKAMFSELGSKTKGYDVLRRWFEKNRCEHRQGSGYRSLFPLTQIEATKLVERLGSENPWLASCVNRFDVTNSGANDFNFTDTLRVAALSAARNVAGINDADSAAASAQNVAADQKAIPADEFVKNVERENENVNE